MVKSKEQLIDFEFLSFDKAFEDFIKRLIDALHRKDNLHKLIRGNPDFWDNFVLKAILDDRYIFEDFVKSMELLKNG